MQITITQLTFAFVNQFLSSMLITHHHITQERYSLNSHFSTMHAIETDMMPKFNVPIIFWGGEQKHTIHHLS